MTFILSNLSNWLTDSQSSESSTGTESRNAEQSNELVTANAARYTFGETTGTDIAEFNDRRNSREEIVGDDDLPGLSKVVNSAIEWGGYLLNYGKETGKHMTRTAIIQIKSAFQEDVYSDEAAPESLTAKAAVAPWVGYNEENLMRKQILSISEDKRNFVRGPPAGVQYRFDYAVSYPVAMVMLNEDPNLKAMRFELVPKQVKEETFWRNYFYRVALVKQSAQLTSLAKHRAPSSESDHKVPSSVPSSDTELVFVADTFSACDDDTAFSNYVEEVEWTEQENPNEELQDFEMVELADCREPPISSTIVQQTVIADNLRE